MASKVLIPLPSTDFDPTESGVPWKILKQSNVEIIFATPNGSPATCDDRMLNGTGIGFLAPILAADKNGRTAYLEMASSPEFKNPISWEQIKCEDYDGLLLPGGHAQGMKEYLESKILQSHIANFFSLNKPVAAICHGVVLAARSCAPNGKSVLHGRKTTALLSSQELLAWSMTSLWLGNYYRTYPQTVEAEVKSNLERPSDFMKGPAPLFRDTPTNQKCGFTVLDGNYLSARWPGDAHLFGHNFLKMMTK